MTNSLPISESYWILPNRFLAGEYPGNFNTENARRRIDAFLEAGFDTFIDLTQPHELVHYESTLYEEARIYEIQSTYTRIPIRDGGIPTAQTMKMILDSIDSALDKNRKLYVHCWGGVGRTGITVGCYLVRHGKTGQQALNQLAEWWQSMPKRVRHPRSPETQEQVEFILNWKE